VIPTLAIALLSTALADAPVVEAAPELPPEAPLCASLAEGWPSLAQSMAARPLETTCVGPDGPTTAADAWHAATREAARAHLGVPGCAQALGLPGTRAALERALRAVEAETACVDVDGEVAVLRPLLVAGEAVPRTLDRWQPRVAAYRPCESGVAPPCVDERGLLRADPTFLKARVRPMPRLDRDVRQGMRAEGLDAFDATVHLEIDERGRVSELTWREGPGWAEDAVTKTLHRWRFEPMSVDGEPATASVDLTLRLSESELRAP